MATEVVGAICAHSIRVGATQDLLTLNVDPVSAMQAGRWKSHRMPLRYGECVMAALGVTAWAARAKGRARVPAGELRVGGMV